MPPACRAGRRRQIPVAAEVHALPQKLFFPVDIHQMARFVMGFAVRAATDFQVLPKDEEATVHPNIFRDRPPL